MENETISKKLKREPRRGEAIHELIVEEEEEGEQDNDNEVQQQADGTSSNLPYGGKLLTRPLKKDIPIGAQY